MAVAEDKIRSVEIASNGVDFVFKYIDTPKAHPGRQRVSIVIKASKKVDSETSRGSSLKSVSPESIEDSNTLVTSPFSDVELDDELTGETHDFPQDLKPRESDSGTAKRSAETFDDGSRFSEIDSRKRPRRVAALHATERLQVLINSAENIPDIIKAGPEVKTFQRFGLDGNSITSDYDSDEVVLQDLSSSDDNASLSEDEYSDADRNGSKFAPKAKSKQPAKPTNRRSLSGTIGGSSGSTRYINEFENRKGASVDDSPDPPITDIYDMFIDLVGNIPEIKNMTEKLLGRSLRVATMCSGTESPLLALRMISKSLMDIYGIAFEFDHVFSCEIEPFKQAYIERNFKPPILFRDVCELGNEFGTTAYGGKVRVPGDVDILIAGTSCVDYSHLNNNQKQISDNGESGRTYRGMRSWVVKNRPPIVILENVCSAPWAVIQEDFESLGYDVKHVRVDTKNYYIPHTRTRGYLCAFNTTKKGMAKDWAERVKALQRPTSCSFEAIMLPADDPRIHQARSAQSDSFDTRKKPTDWGRCEGRHHKARFDEELGQKRPLTAWDEGGQCKLLDFAWSEWGHRQVHRVLDLMDISTLRAAKSGLDPRYKAEVWNLSQNVDRSLGSTRLGICTCITPSIIPYITNRGGPMIGLESLAMQGLPIDELILTRETDDNLFDLSGNAMTTTVVGACMLAALSIGAKLLKPPLTKGQVVTDSNTKRETLFNGEEELQLLDIDLSDYAAVPLDDVLAMCKKSRRMCTCEGRTGITSNAVQHCKDCGFTSCSRCGGRPEHNYVPVVAADRIEPRECERFLKAALPMRLSIKGISPSDFRKPEDGVDEDLWKVYCDSTLKAVAEDLKFQEVRRQDIWTVKFSSRSAYVELKLGNRPEWLLFATVSNDEPANSPVRRMLAAPVARMSLRNSKTLLDGEWKLRLPRITEFKVYLQGSGESIPSWQARMGILGSFANSKVSSTLKIEAACPGEVRDISGDYIALPNCGTATEALYKREKDGLFFFFDPTRSGDPARDQFVFSYDIRRLEYGEHRLVIAKMDPSYRTMPALTTMNSDAETAGEWSVVRGSKIVPYQTMSRPQFKLPSKIISARSDVTDCQYTSTVLVCEVPRVGNDKSKNDLWLKARDNWLEVDEIHEREVFRDLSWLLERVRKIDILQDWKKVQLAADCAECQFCAPPQPGLRLLNIGNRLVLQEDAEQAGTYERLLKQRPAPFMTQLRSEDSADVLRIGLNVAALIHRAVARFRETSLPSEPITASWRLITDFQPLLRLDKPNFKLKSNKMDVEHAQPETWNKKYPLRPEQLRSLSWMIEMESQNVGSFTEEEVVESILQPLGWRAEAKAQRSVTVHGGVLADEVGYGKTAITLGLVSCTQNSLNVPKLPDINNGVIPVKATLVIIPGHLVKQWRSEITKFTGNAFNVTTLSDLVSLNSTTIETMMKADLIIAPSNLFGSGKYLLNLACLSGVQEIPSNAKGGRQFSLRYADAVRKLRSLFKILITGGTLKLRRELDERFKESLHNESGLLLSRRVKGQKLAQSVDTVESSYFPKQDITKAIKERAARLNQDTWGLKTSKVMRDWKQMKCPPFELFKFNRVVIDEYTYLDGSILDMTKGLLADNRWILSGTPPLHDFTSVKSIASFLGIHLGIDDDGEGDSDLVRHRKRERTSVEKFHSFTEVRSLDWHSHRNSIAQRFLDLYLRQNIAEIDEIAWTETHKVVTLTAAERAIYLELEHHLQHLEMQMKKNRRSESDREKRLNRSLGSSATAEEALLKCCSHFDLDYDGHSRDVDSAIKECDVVVHERNRQLEDCSHEFLRLLTKVEVLQSAIAKKTSDVETTTYTEWLYRISQNSIGDFDISNDVRDLVCKAKEDARVHKSKSSRHDLGIDLSEPEHDLRYMIAELMHDIRRLEREFLSRTRSLRFFQAVRMFQKTREPCITCTGCSETFTRNADLALLSSCGHVGCSKCVKENAFSERCFTKGCSALVRTINVVEAESLGVDDRHANERHFGTKLEAVMDLIKNKIPKEDRVLLFVQFDELMQKTATALETRDIPYLKIEGSVKQKSKALDSFQNSGPSNGAKVLLLKVDDESASGANLTMANHVIFLSPLLTETVEGYVARETQAIGRARRYGQLKEVKIWRFFTKNTVDVEIYRNRTGKVVGG